MDAVEIPLRRPFAGPHTAAVPQQQPESVIAIPVDNPPVPDAPAKDKGKQREGHPSHAAVVLPVTDPIPLAPIHPFAATNPRYQKPDTRNFGALPDKRPEGAFKTMAPIVDPTQSKKIFDKCLGTEITLTLGDLMQVSPDIDPPMVEVLTATLDDASSAPRDSTNTSVDPYEVYLRQLAPDHTAEILTVAKDSNAIRAIVMTVDGREDLECIVDSGSQIIAMSEARAVALGLKYDPRIILKMVSANGNVDPSLGLARDVPCTIGGLTLYLQIHIIREPSYDVLLGRPFDVLTKSDVRTSSEDDTTIVITDPNSGEVLAIPTFARNRPKKDNTKPLFHESMM
ncbi:hypothetical protein DXG01_011056 [Tephrocybe rancida]|nr:hypothetical protein DXG01_011056 [Tephrocybe rancida]